ncbi:GAF domain-containing protein [Nonomuraea sp. NPDC050404]|uniref:GAF domain-containing protein n=1 Tax=Nonomuraea sp. NPDC050404 TaxID=3155783 RepID=UPI0033D7391A
MDIGDGDLQKQTALLLDRSRQALRRSRERQLNAAASWQRLAGREAAARELLEHLRADDHAPGAVGRFMLPCLDHADDGDVLTLGLLAALELTGADMGNFQLIDGAGGLRIAAHYGFYAPFLDFFAVVKEETSVCGRAMAARAPVVVRNVERDPSLAGTPAGRALLEAGSRTVHSSPLLDDHGALLGMVSVHYRTVRDLTAAERRLLPSLSRRLGRLLQQSAEWTTSLR